MDLVKIGKYIAGKRKALSLTQRQLAEKLGMSDKSVSKWERGVCLPDVSLYMELCSILGISINEFLAGEDISQEELIQKSEENLIGVTADSKRRQSRLRLIICVLLTLTLLGTALAGSLFFRSEQPENYLEPLDRDSIEMKTAEMLSGTDGAFIYNYTTTDTYSAMKIYISQYQSGELISKENLGLEYNGIGSPNKGKIVIIPDFSSFSIRLIMADEGAKLSTEIPILEDVPGRESYGRSATEISGKTPILYDEEQGMLALIYDNDRMRILAPEDMMDGLTDALADNDYVYYFSVEFCK